MFFKVGALENVAIFTEKHLCRSIFFNKVAGLRAFSVNIAKFSELLSCRVRLVSASVMLGF